MFKFHRPGWNLVQHGPIDASVQDDTREISSSEAHTRQGQANAARNAAHTPASVVYK